MKSSQISEAPSVKTIDNLDDLLQAFSHGLEPDLSNTSQRDAFEIYRRMRFGDPNTDITEGSLEKVAAIIKHYPKVEKELFRDFKLVVQTRTYPVTKELATYLDSQTASAAQSRSNFFQIEANSGYWKKAFQFTEPEGPKLEPLSRDASSEQKTLYREKAKKIKESNQTQWITFLDHILSSKFRTELLEQTKPAWDRATSLFRKLHAERDRLIQESKDVKPISQAVIDLIHTIGYQDPGIVKALKSNDGMERLNAYRKILDERDRFAMELGFDGHFAQVLQEIGQPVGVFVPSGVPSLNGTTESLKILEDGLIAGSKLADASISTRIIRHLSTVESPFRSCLGGSDCSSRTYLTRALDPNYHYFTITDEDGTSSGQITIVLGNSKLHGKKVQIAFVDKIQNVPNIDLPQIIEGVRRSVAEKGYLLALTLTKPFDMQATPVTELQWALVMGDSDSDRQRMKPQNKISGQYVPVYPNHPAEVFWNDVQIFITRLNEMDPKYNYRLPTDAEWEFAARAGTHTAYSFGNDPENLSAYGLSLSSLQDVAGLAPNPDGLYDVHGNIGEWVQDRWGANSPRSPINVDPTGPTSGEYRLIRGSGTHREAIILRSAHTFHYWQDNRGDGYGFRLVRTPKP